MKAMYSRFLVPLLMSFSCLSFAQSETPSAEPTEAQMQTMQQHMQTMQAQMNSMMNAKTPEERQAAMQAHMATMQSHMQSMHQMGCCGQKGMKGGHMQGGMRMGDCMDGGTTH